MPALRRHRRVARVCLVGASGGLVNTAVRFLLVHLAGWHHLPAATLATAVAILTNVSLHDAWTFAPAAADDSRRRRPCSDHAVALGGLAISVATLALLTDRLAVHSLVANLVAIGLASGWNDALTSRLTWALSARRPRGTDGVPIWAPSRVRATGGLPRLGQSRGGPSGQWRPHGRAVRPAATCRPHAPSQWPRSRRRSTGADPLTLGT